MYKEGYLGYDKAAGRYGVLVMDLFEKMFHCGDRLQVMIGDEWVDTIMEMTAKGEWYLVGTPYLGLELEYLKVRIED